MKNEDRVKPLPSQSRLKELATYDPETGEFRRIHSAGNRAPAGSLMGVRSRDRHRYILIDGLSYLAHRLAWMYVHGIDPLGLHIDHINGVPGDNRIANLRLATNAENMWNSRISKRNTSGVKGVFLEKRRQKWTAVFNVNRKQIYVGQFDTFDEAVEKLKIAREKHHREFAHHGDTKTPSQVSP